MLRELALVVLLVLAIAPAAHADDSPWYVPQNVVSQVAGYVGYVSIGAGYRPAGFWDVDVILGYVPESVGGHEIVQVTLKNGLRPFSLDIKGYAVTPFYIGGSLIYGLDEDLYLILPERYPHRYYPQTAIRAALNVGASVAKGRHALFAEFTSLDTSMEAYINNQGFLELEDVVTVGVGYRYHL